MELITEILNFIYKFIYYTNFGNFLTLILSSNFEINLDILDYTGLYQLGVDIIGLAAICIAFTYFCIMFINGLLDGKSNREFILSMFIRLAITILLIKYGPTILRFLIDFGNGILAEILKSYSQAVADKPKTPADLVGGIFVIFTFLFTIFPNLAVILIAIVSINIVTFTRYIELAIYSIGFPFVIPNLMLTGKSSSTIQYVKRFFAICLQGAVMCIIVMACSIFLNNSVSESVLEGSFFIALEAIGSVPAFMVGSIVGIIKDAAITFMFVSMLFRSKQIAMDIIGVK